MHWRQDYICAFSAHNHAVGDWIQRPRRTGVRTLLSDGDTSGLALGLDTGLGLGLDIGLGLGLAIGLGPGHGTALECHIRIRVGHRATARSFQRWLTGGSMHMGLSVMQARQTVTENGTVTLTMTLHHAFWEWLPIWERSPWLGVNPPTRPSP